MITVEQDTLPRVDNREPPILLIAHGSARYAEAARPALAQLPRLRAAAPGRCVTLGLLAGRPGVSDTLARIDAPAIRAVPFFMEDGYFVRVAVPRAIGGDRRVTRCRPVGVHPGMADVVAGHARDGCAARDLVPAEVALLLVGHGSASAPGRAMALRRHAAALAASSLFQTVHIAHLEEPPLLADALAALRPWPVAVVGFFAGEGKHVRDDVPAALAAETATRAGSAGVVHNFGSVADNPALARIILDQAASD
jgi:sirohydrochlorin cobaltochelatase